MFFVNSLQILLFLLFVIKECAGIFFPDFSLLSINFFFIDLFLLFLIDLSCKILSHLGFLLLSDSFASLLFLFFFSKLIFNVSHHFLILSPDLFFLVFDNWISERSHDCFDLLLTFFFLFLSLLLELILKSCVLFLCLDILNMFKFTSILYLYSYYLNLFWFSSFSTITCWNLCLSLYFLSLN